MASGAAAAGAAASHVPRPVGVGVRPVAVLAAEVRSVVAGFDPELVSARDCVDLVAVFSDIEHAVSAELALAARRVAQTNVWEHKGHRSAAHWLASKTGMAVGDAVRMLATAEVAESAPATMEALKAGDLSTRQAHAVGAAEAADPRRGVELLGRATGAGNVSVREIEQDSARIVHAASGETEQARTQRIRERRAFRVGSNGDGSSWAHVVGPTADLARLEAAIGPVLNDIFLDAREQGRRESRDAYAFDALMALADHGAPQAGAAAEAGAADASRSGDRWRFAKVIVRADLGALDRGHPEPGERCEIAGQGPVPVGDVWKMIDGGAFVAGIVTEGTEITKVRHLGRRPTVLQRTVLEWETAGTCVVEGCTNTVCIQIDHVDDWARTQLTEIAALAAMCKRCHDLKTHRGYTLGPRLPNGKRRLIAPGEQPDDRDAADAAPVDLERSGEQAEDTAPAPGHLSPHTGRTEQTGRTAQAEQSERTAQAEQSERTAQAEQGERTAQAEQGERTERTEQTGLFDTG